MRKAIKRIEAALETLAFICMSFYLMFCVYAWACGYDSLIEFFAK